MRNSIDTVGHPAAGAYGQEPLTCGESLEGTLERIVFFNEENGYTVARIRTEGDGGHITAVGNLLGASPGELLVLAGNWTTDARYGRQFKVDSFRTSYPITEEAIRKYLGSGIVRGIGPVMAGRIVDCFGRDTLEIIEKDCGRLADVPGIGSARVDMIARAWKEQRGIRDVMLFLQGHGVSAGHAARIYKTYGDDAVRIVSGNPYRLAFDIFGIGFKTADLIARRLGLPEDSSERMQAALAHQLQAAVDEGHVYLPEDRLTALAAEAIGMEQEQLLPQVDRLGLESTVIIDAAFTPRRIYLKTLFYAEEGIARIIKGFAGVKGLAALPMQTPMPGNGKILLSARQMEAVSASMAHSLLVVTGGPGTGKTTVIRSVMDLHEGFGRRLLLCAPTGRAAKRMSEATGREARTIHRLLEFSPAEGGFRRNEQNPLEADTVIVDEASMIDVMLGCHLLKALAPTTTLILVGDTDQLPSVGPGNFLRDLISSGSVGVVRLTDIYRQSESSLIVSNAHRINSGLMPLPAGKDGDFFFIREDDPQRVLDIILSLCADRLPARYLLDPVEDIQVLAPMHRGLTGAVSLNAALQARLNPSGRELSRSGRTFRCGDKVMQLVNNYDKDVYNGDIGRIASIDVVEQSLQVDVDGRTLSYDFSELDELALAYAVTVHKSQGSEYPAVILPLLTQHYMMLQRNLLYTAVTRARKLAVIIGSSQALRLAVGNSRVDERFSGLVDRLTPCK